MKTRLFVIVALVATLIVAGCAPKHPSGHLIFGVPGSVYDNVHVLNMATGEDIMLRPNVIGMLVTRSGLMYVSDQNHQDMWSTDPLIFVFNLAGSEKYIYDYPEEVLANHLNWNFAEDPAGHVYLQVEVCNTNSDCQWYVYQDQGDLGFVKIKDLTIPDGYHYNVGSAQTADLGKMMIYKLTGDKNGFKFYLWDTTTGDITDLNMKDSWDFPRSISPDGSTLIYEAISGLYLIDLATMNQIQIYNKVVDANIFSFSWSPDGKYVTVVLPQEKGGDAEVFDIRGRKVSAVSVPFPIANSIWSPDGSTIALAAMDIDKEIARFYTITKDGRDLTEIYSRPMATALDWTYLFGWIK